MAEVAIKITSADGSAIKIAYAPSEGKKGLQGRLASKWTKPDWDAMATNDGAATKVAEIMGVSVEDLRAGIAAMQAQTLNYGPAVYRAPCGHEVYRRKDGPKEPMLKDLLIAWKGHPDMKTEWLRTDGEVPEKCKGCRRLLFHPKSYFPNGNFLDLAMWWCNAHKIVPVAVPPAAAEPEGSG